RVNACHSAPAMILDVVGCSTPATADIEQKSVGSFGIVPQRDVDRLFFPCVGIITLPDQREELFAAERIHLHRQLFYQKIVLKPTSSAAWPTLATVTGNEAWPKSPNGSVTVTVIVKFPLWA